MLLICLSCKRTRSDNAFPCPHCGASSPLSANSGPHRLGLPTRDQKKRQHLPGVDVYLDEPSGFNIPIVSFEDVPTTEPQPIKNPTVLSQTGPIPLERKTETTTTRNPNSLPVLYQPQSRALSLPPQHERLPARSDTPPPDEDENLPAVVEEQEELVYIPSHYRNERVTIPRYRVISGLLSFLVVSLLVCGALGFSLYRNGTWSGVGQYLGLGSSTSGVSATNANFPDPPSRIDQGPAFAIIPTVTMSTRLQNGLAVGRETIFKLNQTIYLGYTVQKPPADGHVVIKWYANGHTSGTPERRAVVKGQDIQNGLTTVRFSEPTQGTVEIYWNDQLAQKLFFVVR